MAVGTRQSIKKQFPSYHKVFHHLTCSTQSEWGSPLIFYEQKTTRVGMLTPETGVFCSPCEKSRTALAIDAEQQVDLET